MRNACISSGKRYIRTCPRGPEVPRGLPNEAGTSFQGAPKQAVKPQLCYLCCGVSCVCVFVFVLCVCVCVWCVRACVCVYVCVVFTVFQAAEKRPADPPHLHRDIQHVQANLRKHRFT